jgi:hypothetical protein
LRGRWRYLPDLAARLLGSSRVSARLQYETGIC